MAEEPLVDEAWDVHERDEIIAYIPLDPDSRMSFHKRSAEIQEGCCFEINNFYAPFRWKDFEAEFNAAHLAVSNSNVMYLLEKHGKHVVNPCPPCMCCFEFNWSEDYGARIRKLIPLEKITDIEVQEAGSNELLTPGCICFPPNCCKCNPESLESLFSKSAINTAGSIGPELIIEGIQDANGFRRLVMDLKKRGGGGGPSDAPKQQSMSGGPQMIGASEELVSLLKGIYESNLEIARSNREMVSLMQSTASQNHETSPVQHEAQLKQNVKKKQSKPTE
eukprot:gnl/MRDRNA2_/MRDRNA2_152927_c0_seq1.p1 gnl/MRDRNA2_/MRDRNA2_152927_c0~~gnl/MRDRNA2_/MRDRNA2_152927_c0_seq1.p1  ORF type:complete len:278 (+),score=52.63 gnl/MRDRNA2_/MRDRNA2_152927_c0_seq1:72-905(+)